MKNITIEDLDAHIAELQAFGLSRQEAMVYITLLQSPGLTGYGVARKIGKSAANMYKILQTLESKGMILGEQGRNPRSYRAISIPEFAGSYREKMEARLSDLENRFRSLEPDDEATGGIYPLADLHQMWSKARSMVDRAEEVVVVNRLGEIPADFREALTRKSAGGVDVVAKVSDDDPLTGCHVVQGMGSIRWTIPGGIEWLDVLVDGKESLIAFRDRGKLEAFWTDNRLLSFNIYNGNICEFFLHRLSETMAMDEDTGFFGSLRDVNHLRASRLSAFRELVLRMESRTEEG